ncbi:MAG: FliM/FliN family flagellar motor C-terminal domain-containing protein [Candidatus Gastranaerophilales bacterium]|nr:FliM/FliN family flagellar motor C-terminal domain-containing protein [Candidatus Gastranaerophilales bacterium]
MVATQYNSDFSKDLGQKFYWFKRVISQKTKERIKEFFLSDFNLKIVGLSEKDNVLFSGEEYFVTRIKVNKESDIFFRISSKFMDSLLSSSLGDLSVPFRTDMLTELEAKILTSFNDFIYKGIAPFLSKEIDTLADESLINRNLLHITFLSLDDIGNVGKFIISLPINLLPEIRNFVPVQNFDMGSFPKYKVPVKIITGKSEITLYDVRNIERGDIVVLEQSDIRTMKIDLMGQTTDFLINPETSIITGVENNNEEAEANNMKQSGNMWDVIPVEITAEFDSVTVTLGDLKAISEGSIVDVGAIYENKIFLKVENKPIASGELIIINDKYAVRVDEVYTDKSNQPAPQQQNMQPQPAQRQAAPRPQNPQQQNPNGEDFNYNNFDIEDEDI